LCRVNAELFSPLEVENKVDGFKQYGIISVGVLNLLGFIGLLAGFC
jgi:hypothetical protein